MQLIDGRPVYAATDLVGFLACDHRLELERAALAGLVAKPIRNDPSIELVAKRGIEHELRYLEDLREQGRRVVEIDKDGSAVAPLDALGEPVPRDAGAELRAAAEQTIAAMRGGADVVYQATFFDGTWRGHADFLLRRTHDAGEPDSALGPWHYEVADTKLARHVKASAILQICSYVEQLTAVQGQQPEYLYVVLGGRERPTDQLRVDDYMAYYRRRESGVRGGGRPARGHGQTGRLPAVGTYPEPVEHCDVCRWARAAASRRRADDDLSLVAGAGSRPRRALKARGIPTRRGLAGLRAADGWSRSTASARRAGPDPRAGQDPGASPRTRTRSSGSCCRSIVTDRRAGRRPRPARPAGAEPGRPVPGPRGRPLRARRRRRLPVRHPRAAPGRGRPVGRRRQRSRSEVPRDLEPRRRGARDLGVREGRVRADDRPDHGPLGGRPGDARLPLRARTSGPPSGGSPSGTAPARRRSTACSAAGCWSTCSASSDRASWPASRATPSRRSSRCTRSIRELDLKDAGSSIVAFETWLEMGPDAPVADAEAILDRHRGLQPRRRREQLVPPRLAGGAPARPRGPRGAARAAGARRRRGDEGAHRSRTGDRGAIGRSSPADDPGRPGPPAQRPEAAGRWLLAQLLTWHRREDKSAWWRFYELMGKTDDELIAEREPIGGLHLVDSWQVKSSIQYKFTFPAQDHRIGEDSTDQGSGDRRARRAPSSRSTTRPGRSPSPAAWPERAIPSRDRSSRRESCRARSWQRASCERGTGSPSTGWARSTRTTHGSRAWPRSAHCSCAGRPMPDKHRQHRCGEPDESALTAATADRGRCGRRHPPDPGATGLRQDVHGRPGHRRPGPAR